MEQVHSIFDECFSLLLSSIENYGWFILFVIVVFYTFEIPQKISRLPGKIDDYLNGSNRKKILDKDMRRIWEQDHRDKTQKKTSDENSKSDKSE